MSWIVKSLWDLIAPHAHDEKPHAHDEKPQAHGEKPLAHGGSRRFGDPSADGRTQPTASAVGFVRKAATRAAPPKQSMRARYDALVTEMKKTYGVRVRKWRSSSTGCAWEVRYANGSTARLIESPYPKGPMSCAIFLHEIGHHAIGFKTYRLRCLEEYHAWKWAIETMRERGLNVTEAVERRMAESLHYAIAKARRRGLRDLPIELMPYVNKR